MITSRKERFFRIVPAILLIALAMGCGKRGPREFASREGVEKKTKLVLIGIDGLEPKLLDKYLKKGKMPVLEKLIENGAQSLIKCVAGMTSPVVWTTVATGVMPEVHGITGFTVDDLPVTSTIRRVPAFWNMLEQCKINAATVGWQVSWPAEKDSGIIVSDRAYWGKFEDKTFPADAIDLARYRRKYFTDLDDLAKFTNFPFDPDYESLDRDDPGYAVNFLIERRLMDVYVRDTMYTEIAMEVVEKHNPEVLAVYFHGVDYTGHGFWKWYQPKPFIKAGWTIPEEEPDLLADVIPLYYEYTDTIIGRILDYVGGEPLVILLSDHGFGPRTKLSDPVTGEKKNQPANLGDFITGNHRS
ncbi:MAG: alkaline phosphatase family protein, partial [Planctomycetota bacterium]